MMRKILWSGGVRSTFCPGRGLAQCGGLVMRNSDERRSDNSPVYVMIAPLDSSGQETTTNIHIPRTDLPAVIEALEAGHARPGSRPARFRHGGGSSYIGSGRR